MFHIEQTRTKQVGAVRGGLGCDLRGADTLQGKMGRNGGWG
jgi:hypothetical protein